MANVSINFVMKVWYVAAPVSLTVPRLRLRKSRMRRSAYV